MVPEHLGVLNLSFNKLKALPASLGKAPVLQQMYLANNQLVDLPGSFSQVGSPLARSDQDMIDQGMNKKLCVRVQGRVLMCDINIPLLY